MLKAARGRCGLFSAPVSQAAAPVPVPVLHQRTRSLFRRAGTRAGLGQDSCIRVNIGYLNTGVHPPKN